MLVHMSKRGPDKITWFERLYGMLLERLTPGSSACAVR